MAFACPHCSKDIPGVADEATIKARLDAQKAAHQTVAEKLQADAAAAQADLARLRPIAERAEAVERDLHYTRAGVAPEAAKYVEALYTMHRAEAGDKALARDAWLASDEAKANPLLAGVLAKPAGSAAPGAPATPGTQAAPPAPPAPAKPAAPAAPPPAANAGVVAAPPAPAGKLTRAQLNARLEELAAPVRAATTPEARAKARAAYDAERAVLVTQLDAAPSVAT